MIEINIKFLNKYLSNIFEHKKRMFYKLKLMNIIFISHDIETNYEVYNF
jgi:hypothetical protein